MLQFLRSLIYGDDNRQQNIERLREIAELPVIEMPDDFDFKSLDNYNFKLRSIYLSKYRTSNEKGERYKRFILKNIIFLHNLLKITTSVPSKIHANNFPANPMGYDVVMGTDVFINDYLSEDTNNIILVYIEGEEFKFHLYKLNLLTDKDNMFVQCNQDRINRLASEKAQHHNRDIISSDYVIHPYEEDILNFNEWYVKISVIQHIGIAFECVKKILNFVKINKDAKKIFFIDEKTTITPISNVNAIQIYPEENIFTNRVNLMSMTHCGSSTSLDVYKNVHYIQSYTTISD